MRVRAGFRPVPRLRSSIPSDRGKEDREEGVEDDDEEDRSDDCGGRAAADFLGILPHLHPRIAAGDADQYAEHRRLDQHRPEIGHRDDLAQPLNIGERRDVEPDPRKDAAAGDRSEEHTSELQSLMRISYAVFCLKKKTAKTATKTNKENHTY